MSKMSQLHAELSEQASELGFSSIEEAEANGYEADYEKRKLVDGRELAHEAWLKERDEVIKDLDHIALGYAEAGFNDHAEKLYKAINFIMRGET